MSPTAPALRSVLLADLIFRPTNPNLEIAHLRRSTGKSATFRQPVWSVEQTRVPTIIGDPRILPSVYLAIKPAMFVDNSTRTTNEYASLR